MSNPELYELFQSVATGAETLHNLSETGGDDTTKNYARILFFALGAHLLERGIIDSLARCGSFLLDSESAELYEESVFTSVN